MKQSVYKFYINGEETTLAKIAETININRGTLANRIRQSGRTYSETIMGYKIKAVKI